MPKIGDFGIFRDTKGNEAPCVVTGADDEGHLDLHVFHTNMRGVEVAMSGPDSVTVLGGVLPLDWGKDVTPAIPSPAPRSLRELSDMGPQWNDPRISARVPLPGLASIPMPADPVAASQPSAVVVADEAQQAIPPEASLAPAEPPKPEGT